MRQIVLIILLIFYIANTNAEGFAYPILLIKKMVKKVSQEDEDELYYSIFETHQNDDKSNDKLTREPEFPLYFSSNRIQHLKDYIMWRGLMRNGDTIKLAITLMEQDFPPWNPDDLIGVLNINVFFSTSNLKVDWNIEGVQSLQATTYGNKHEQLVRLATPNTEYHILFELLNGQYHEIKAMETIKIDNLLFPYYRIPPHVMESLDQFLKFPSNMFLNL